MYFLSMEMVKIRTEIRGMSFPEKPSLEISSIAGSQPRTSRSVDLFATDCATPHPLMSISSAFYVRVFHTKLFFSSYVSAKKAFSYKKRVHKTLMKLTPVVSIWKSMPKFQRMTFYSRTFFFILQAVKYLITFHFHFQQ